MDGGYVGFSGGGILYVDNMKVESYDGTNWVTAALEDFEVTSGAAQVSPTHDYVGNMTYDGLRKFFYDPWNRLTGVKTAWRDTNGVQTGPTIAAIAYDGDHRRISKTITNSGDWNCAYHYYLDGSNAVEARNGSDQTIKTYIWGTQYAHELLGVRQTSSNGSGGRNAAIIFSVNQDPHYNVVSISTGGTIVEQYEYTPYGERAVHMMGNGSSNQVYPTLNPQQWTDYSPPNYQAVAQPWEYCEFGAEGMMYDKEFGLYYNDARYRHPVLARFMGPDPTDYPDGNSRYEMLRSNPGNGVDPSGNKTIADYIEDIGCLEKLRLQFVGPGEGVDDVLENLAVIQERDNRIAKNGVGAAVPELQILSEEEGLKGPIQSILNRAAFLGVDPLALDDESQVWKDSTGPYAAYLAGGTAQGAGNGLANTGYSIITLGFAGQVYPCGGKDNPAHDWGYFPARIAGEVASFEIPTKYLGYAGKLNAVRLTLQGVQGANKIRNIVMVGQMGGEVAEDIVNGKADLNTVFKVMVVGTTAFVIHKAYFAEDGANGLRNSRLTRPQTRDLAKYESWNEVKGTPFDSHGQPVFTDGKKFYTPDVDAHRGGVWKVFDKKGNRIGTVDENLNRVGE